MSPDRRGPSAILEAARLVIGGPSCLERARAISAEIAALSGADDVAPVVERLAAAPQRAKPAYPVENAPRRHGRDAQAS